MDGRSKWMRGSLSSKLPPLCAKAIILGKLIYDSNVIIAEVYSGLLMLTTNTKNISLFF